MRASDFRTSLSQVESVWVPSGDLQLMTFSGPRRRKVDGRTERILADHVVVDRLAALDDRSRAPDRTAPTDSSAGSACRCALATPARSRPRTWCRWWAPPATIDVGIQRGQPLVDVNRLRRQEIVDLPGPAPEDRAHELLGRRPQVVLESPTGPGLTGRGSADSSAGSLVFANSCADVEPVEHDVGQVGLSRRQREQPIDLRGDAGRGRQAAVGGRRDQRGVRERAEQRERELAGDLVGRQRGVGIVAVARRPSASAVPARSGKRTTGEARMAFITSSMPAL